MEKWAGCGVCTSDSVAVLTQTSLTKGYRSMRNTTLAAWLLGSVALVGCTTDTEDGTCSDDFDCPVGEICAASEETTDSQEADEAAAGNCESAGAGADRLFGRGTVEFSSDELYLLTVVDVPTGEASPDADVFFTLTASGGASGALTLRRGTPAGAGDDPSLAARSAFEQSRRSKINQLVDDLNAGRRSLEQAVPRAADCGGCQDNNICDNNSQCVSTLDLKFADGTDINTSVVAVVDDEPTLLITVLLDDALSGSTGAAEDAQAVAEDFAKTVKKQLAIMGESSHAKADRDGDGRLTVVFSNHIAVGIDLGFVGFFAFEDFLASTDTDATGNERDILWSRLPGATNDGGEISVMLAVGTLAHEYTHLMSYALRVHQRNQAALREVLWLDEGLAHLTEDLTGWGPSNVGSVGVALSEWPNGVFAGPEATSHLRGQAYLLLRHMVDQRAKGQGATTAAEGSADSAATTLVSALINEEALGFKHQMLQDAGAEGLGEWLLAVYATGNDEVTETAAHARDFLPTAVSNETGNLMGINPYDTMENARGAAVELDGPAFEYLDDPDGETSGEMMASGSVFYEVTSSEAGSFTIEARGDAQSDLHMKVTRVQ